jgi:hypothetical protein
MKKMTLFTLKVMAISIIAFLLLPLTTAAFGLTLDSPEEGLINEKFEVKIDADSSELFDVKIFVHDSEGGVVTRDEYTSEIYNDGWKDPWYYLLEAFPAKKQYTIIVPDKIGRQDICVKLRKTDAPATIFKTCNEILVVSLEGKSEEEEDEPVIEPEPEVFEQETQEMIEKKNEPPQENITLEPIVLNPPPSETPEKTEQQVETEEHALEQPEVAETTTKSETIRTWITYSFIGFAIVIIILLSLRKL